jgi:hypothetical protein
MPFLIMRTELFQNLKICICYVIVNFWQVYLFLLQVFCITFRRHVWFKATSIRIRHIFVPIWFPHFGIKTLKEQCLKQNNLICFYLFLLNPSSFSKVIRGCIQNISHWCRHLYSSCGSTKHRYMVGLPCLVGQCAKLHLAVWMWVVFTPVYFESCMWPVVIFMMNRRKEQRMCIKFCANLGNSAT